MNFKYLVIIIREIPHHFPSIHELSVTKNKILVKVERYSKICLHITLEERVSYFFLKKKEEEQFGTSQRSNPH